MSFRRQDSSLAHADAATVEFRSPNGKTVVVFVDQVFAVTDMSSTGATAIIGPANATMFVEGTVKDARDRLVAAITHAPKEGNNGI